MREPGEGAVGATCPHAVFAYSHAEKCVGASCFVVVAQVEVKIHRNLHFHGHAGVIKNATINIYNFKLIFSQLEPLFLKMNTTIVFRKVRRTKIGIRPSDPTTLTKFDPP